MLLMNSLKDGRPKTAEYYSKKINKKRKFEV
jgi:hypothetical protein